MIMDVGHVLETCLSAVPEDINNYIIIATFLIVRALAYTHHLLCSLYQCPHSLRDQSKHPYSHSSQIAMKVKKPELHSLCLGILRAQFDHDMSTCSTLLRSGIFCLRDNPLELGGTGVTWLRTRCYPRIVSRGSSKLDKLSGDFNILPQRLVPERNRGLHL